MMDADRPIPENTQFKTDVLAEWTPISEIQSHFPNDPQPVKKKEKTDLPQGCLSLIFILGASAILFVPIFGIGWLYYKIRPWDKEPEAKHFVSSQEWYEGGTLLRATPEQWRKSDERDKLATSADCIAKLWMDKRLEPSMQERIKSMDDLKPYSQQLKNEIDQALRNANGSPRVSEAAAAVILLLGWAK